MMLIKSLLLPSIHDAASRRLLVSLMVFAVCVPILNTIFSEGSIFYVSSFTITLMGKYLCYALLALALDLVWGYCGILSLGHGAFFAIGGYAMGMYLMRQIGDRGVYGNAELPDFMVFLNWTELPWFWYGFDMFWFAMAMVIIIPALLAYVFGFLAFRSRVSGVYLSIMTQALTFALMKVFLLNDIGFGGSNGLTDFKEIVGADITSDTTRIVLFMCSAGALMIAYILAKFITQSKAGRVLIAIRDAELKSRFIGYRVENFKLFIFVLSAIFAAIAGALFVPQVGIINPDEFNPINSIYIVIWVAVGGRGTLYGAIIGAFLVNYLKSWFTGSFPEIWLFFLGFLFIASTLFFPKGLVGLWADSAIKHRISLYKQQLIRRISSKRSPS